MNNIAGDADNRVDDGADDISSGMDNIADDAGNRANDRDGYDFHTHGDGDPGKLYI